MDKEIGDKNTDELKEIFDGINELKQLSALIGTYEVERKIEGPTKEVLDKEGALVKKLEVQKLELLRKVDRVISGYRMDNFANDKLDIIKQLEYTLAGMNIDNIMKVEKKLEEYKYSILKSKKDKTLEEEIEIYDYENSRDEIEFIERENERKVKQEIDREQNKNRTKTKNNVKVKIVQFFNKLFNKKKMLPEKSEVNIKAKELHKKDKEKSFKEKLQEQATEHDNKSDEELRQEELQRYFESVENAKKYFKESSKLYSSETEWKNGNIVVKGENSEQIK